MDENKNDKMTFAKLAEIANHFNDVIISSINIPKEMQMSATLWVLLEKVKHEATRAREYLRLTSATCTPDRVHEILHLRTSRATLARKMREACKRGELLRVPYTNERGTKIVQYAWNPNYKESK